MQWVKTLAYIYLLLPGLIPNFMVLKAMMNVKLVLFCYRH
jgi:hypothetical protein